MTTDTTKLDGLLRKVQGLLAQADHANTAPEEANTFRAKAEALMIKYRIDEATLASGTQGNGIDPTWHTFLVCPVFSEFATHYRHIAKQAMDHLSVRGVFKTQKVENEYGSQVAYVAECVGYDSDLRIAEALYTSMMLAFQQRLEPKYDPDLTQQENAYNMRSAGMEGWRIAQAIFGRDDKSLRPKVRAMFRAEALRRGEDPSVLLGKGNSVKVFRTSYADGFAVTIGSRLQQMRLSRGEASGELVLANRSERVNEAFYERYPQYRPVSGSVKQWVDPRHGCAKCAKAKSGYCRDHGYLRPRVVRRSSENVGAYYRGRDAARTVDLGATPSGSKVTTTTPRGEL